MNMTYPIRDKEKLQEFKTYYYKQQNWRNYLLVVMGLNTALRVSDMLTLRWIDVYDEKSANFRKHIALMEHKTGKHSVIAINACLLDALMQYHDKQPEDSYLFCVSNDPYHYICRSQAWRIIKKAATAAGMEEHISCHSLRKTFGYYAWKQGVSPAVLMDIYNHSSYRITRRYLGIDQDDRDQVFHDIMI